MEQSIQLLEFLNNLIISTTEDTVKINKMSLANIKKNLHYDPETIEFLQLESQLQCDELQ